MLTELLREALDQIPEREDATDGKLHVSDVANGCNLFKWHNIHHGTLKQFDFNTRLKFEEGYAWEANFDRLVEPKILRAGWRRVEHYREELDGVVGHADRAYVDDTRRLLVELKSTASKYQDDPAKLETSQTQWFIQTAAYAKMLQADQALIFVNYRSLGAVGEYPVDIERFYSIYLKRLEIMRTALGDSQPEPVLPTWTIRKGGSYLCKSCPIVTCRYNPERSPDRTP